MEIVFLLPTAFVFVLIAIYHHGRKQAAREVEWEKNKDKYKYKGYRY
jgi:hypothetical protein